VADESARIAELTAIIEAARERVRARYPLPDGGAPDSGSGNGVADAGAPAPRRAIRISVADLMPLVHARDATQAKIASIGSVNPRAGGLLNRIIQAVKKLVARMLQWFVRDQIAFNREAVSSLEAAIEVFNEHNRLLLSLASQANDQIESRAHELTARFEPLIEARTRELSAQIEARARELSQQVDARAIELSGQVEARARDLNLQVDARALELHDKFEAVSLARAQAFENALDDLRKHWIEYRNGWDSKVAANEIQFLRSVADLQGAFQHRSTLMESNFRDIVKAQHADYLGALDRANIDIQKRLWEDMRQIRQEYERLIHTELRVIRQRAPSAEPNPSPGLPAPLPADGFDYGRFAERFRGTEDYVRGCAEFYLPFFAACENVLDIGCGRGEFLSLLRDKGIQARGIDLSPESVAQCRKNGLDAEAADLFPYLAGHLDEFDGIFCAQVVEHLEPRSLPEMIRLCAASLRRGGILAIETPNPESLAIFATHFYLDPTHTRPVPHPLMAFYLEEAGFGLIEVHKRSPALESMPEVAELPENFRDRFFGGLDYAIMGRRL
jgi:O-antigen chain-terminating methyltransferase